MTLKENLYTDNREHDRKGQSSVDITQLDYSYSGVMRYKKFFVFFMAVCNLSLAHVYSCI